MLLNANDLTGKDELFNNEEILAVAPDLLQDAEEYLKYKAFQVNVAFENIKPTYTVRRFLTDYVFKELCLRKAYGAPKTWDKGADIDVYASKYEFYKKDLATIEASLDAYELTGNSSDESYRAVSIGRG